MATITFDTHRIVKDLQDAGFDEAQAEAVVKALGETIDRDTVKPEDLKDFATKADIGGVREDTKTDIGGVREEISELRQDMVEFRGEMHTELKALELRMTVRLTGAMIAVVGLAVAILKLFP